MMETCEPGSIPTERSPKDTTQRKHRRKTTAPIDTAVVKRALDSMDPAKKKKLFGNLTIRDVALHGVRDELPSIDGEIGSGVRGYKVNPKARFNFNNKMISIQKHNIPRFFDALMKEKAKIPSPDKYSQLGNMMSPRPHEFGKVKRKTFAEMTMEISKKTPGVGKYETTQFDEKYKKGVRGGAVPQKTDNFNYVDEAMTIGRESPGFYNEVPMVSKLSFNPTLTYYYLQEKTMRRTNVGIKIRAETEKELEKKQRMTKKDNSPSPTSYLVDQAFRSSAGFHKLGHT